jgi:carbon-monoxide dehydrogenase large subunit
MAAAGHAGASPVGAADSPGSPAGKLVGVSIPRPKAAQLAAGRGRYTDDVRLPGMLHAAFLRSPYAHARIVSSDAVAARALPGVVAVLFAADLLALCKPWLTSFPTLLAHRSVPQPPLADGRAMWQGQPVAIVVAESRALAEDALALLSVEYEELEPLATAGSALAEGAPVLHPTLGSNLLFEHRIDSGESRPDSVSLAFRFPRHTGVPLEARSLVAEFDASLRQLSVHASTQVPHQLRAILSEQLGLPEQDVRVQVPDVGGGFGIKLHCYDDEVAVAAAAMLVGKPVKFVSDRLEAFGSDIHARGHEVEAGISVGADGRIHGFRVDDLMEAGAYSVYPRSSALEGLQAVMNMGAPYAAAAHHARLRVAFQNKPQVGSYRGVGQPIGCAVTEMLVDAAARAVGMDPAEFRRINYRIAARDGATTKGGIITGPEGTELSFIACLDKLLEISDYAGLRARQAESRNSGGPLLGIGLATFIEQSAPGPQFYGAAGVRISTFDGCTLRLEPSGSITCVTSTVFQGQGVETSLLQLIADRLSVPMSAVRLVSGDTAVTPVGGGTWASRGLAIGGEAALASSEVLAERILGAAAAMLEVSVADLELRDGAARLRGTDRAVSFAEIGALMHYAQHKLPAGVVAEPVVTTHYTPQRPYFIANGMQASLVEVDPDSGFVTLLDHWIVEDCGRVINPLLADEQLRGGVVQGIGAALFEECRYDERAQLLSASMADYLVPMAGEMPDIVVGHVETPVADTRLGGKGVGEAGIVGASAAVANAINDALSPLLPAGRVLTELPVTPERILRALGKVA